MVSNSSKPREPRLRASCDNCFLAKVRCSKDRPICSRCLTNGGNCNYSPSSRAGKPKSDGSSKRTPASNQASYNNILFTMSDSIAAHMPTPAYELNNSPVDAEASLPRSVPEPSILGIPEHMLSFTSSSMELDPRSMPGNMAQNVPVSTFDSTGPINGHQGQYVQPFLSTTFVSAQPPTWNEPAAMASFYLPPVMSTMPTSGLAPVHFPPSAPCDARADSGSPEYHPDGTAMLADGTCGCFFTLLQSMHSLHSLQCFPRAEPVTLDVVWSLNRRARESCAALLSCQICMHQNGTHTAAMALGIVIRQVLTIYKNASHPHFETGLGGGGIGAAQRGTGLSVSVGAYRLGEEGARQLWLETLNRELSLLENVHHDFQKVCAGAELCRDVARHLENELGSTLARHRRSSHVVGSP